MVTPRENRIPIMMSDVELESIDNWRFKNRVATRSSAVRQLCYRGLEYSGNYQKLEDGIYKALLGLERYVADHPSAADVPTINFMADVLMRSAYEAVGGHNTFDEEIDLMIKEERMVKGVSPAHMLKDFVAAYGEGLYAFERPIHPYWDENY